MKTKLRRTSIYQTGVTILTDKDGNEKTIPLFTDTPLIEALELRRELFSDYEIKCTYYANKLMNYKIEDMIREFYAEYHFLPENYVDELASGFPHIVGYDYSPLYFYK